MRKHCGGVRMSAATIARDETLELRLKALRLPSFLEQYIELAERAAAEGWTQVRYLAELVTQEADFKGAKFNPEKTKFYVQIPVSRRADFIALAGELSATRVILDDKKARRIARQLNLPVTGTVALMIQAKQRGLIDNLSDVLDQLTAVGFFLSDSLAAAALRQVGE